MGEISAEITNTIYFSTTKPIENDFGFSINYKKDKSQKSIQVAEPNTQLIIYILGLEQLFKHKDEMIEFANALNIHKDEGWAVSFSDDEELVVSCSAQKLENDFSIHFSTLYKFTKEFKDNDSFLVKAYCDTPYSDCKKNKLIEYSITAYEMPCIKSVTVLNSKGIETSSIIMREKANIQWKTNVESPTQGSVVLYDENKKELEKNEVTIDKDRIFTLVVTKHQKVESQDIPIKAVYIDKLELRDFNDNVTAAIYKGDFAKICWSLVNGEFAKTTLIDERGVEVAHLSPYAKIIEKDESYTLHVEKDGVETSRTLHVFCTLWNQKPKYLNIPFQLENLSYNKIIRISEKSKNDGYYLYIHPYLYYSTDLLEWKILPNANEPFDRQTYYNSTLSIIDNQQSIVTCHIDDLYITIRSYNLDTNQWEELLFCEKIILRGCKDEKLLFCHLMKYKCHKTGMYGDIYDSLFIVHEHSIYVRDICEGYFSSDIKCYIELPEDAGRKPTIISIDTIVDYEQDKNYLAILCDDACVYVYEADLFFKHCNFKCKTKLSVPQKKVYLVKTDFVYIITDHFQFTLDGNDIVENWFAPRKNPFVKKWGPMFVGQKSERMFSVMIKADNFFILWTYNSTQE